MDSIIRIDKELTLYLGWAKHRRCVVVSFSVLGCFVGFGFSVWIRIALSP